MTKVLATCESCGDVELTTAGITVHTWTADGPGYYAFRCPRCELDNVNAVEPDTVDLLLAGGATIETWQRRPSTR